MISPKLQSQDLKLLIFHSRTCLNSGLFLQIGLRYWTISNLIRKLCICLHFQVVDAQNAGGHLSNQNSDHNSHKSLDTIGRRRKKRVWFCNRQVIVLIHKPKLLRRAIYRRQKDKQSSPPCGISPSPPSGIFELRNLFIFDIFSFKLIKCHQNQLQLITNFIKVMQ